MILLSAHRDKVKTEYRFEYKNGKFLGLLDNVMGEYLISDLMISDPALRKLEKMGKVGLFFGDSEEWSTITDMPKLTTKDLVIVVDVCSGSQYNGLSFSLENINGIEKNRLKEVKESLEWEGFKFRTKLYDGNPDDEDEAFYWVGKGIPVFSFIIPIEPGSKNTGWHVDDCALSIDKLVTAKQGLTRLLNYLL